jgi:hypothetical protein
MDLGTLPSDDPKYKKRVGKGWVQMHGLYNLRIGASGNQVAVRFRAELTGNLQAIGFYAQSGSGYALGNGGGATITLREDAGGKLGAILGSNTHSFSGDGHSAASGKAIQTRVNLTGHMIAGRHYWVVFENGDQGNYTSFNNASLRKDMGSQPHVWQDPNDWSVWYGPLNNLQNYSTGAHPQLKAYPILALHTDKGTFGYTPIEGGAVQRNTTRNGPLTCYEGKKIAQVFHNVRGQLEGLSVALGPSVQDQVFRITIKGVNEVGMEVTCLWKEPQEREALITNYYARVYPWWHWFMPSAVFASGDVTVTIESDQMFGCNPIRWGGPFQYGGKPVYTADGRDTGYAIAMMPNGQFLPINHNAWQSSSSNKESQWPMTLHLL